MFRGNHDTIALNVDDFDFRTALNIFPARDDVEFAFIEPAHPGRMEVMHSRSRFSHLSGMPVWSFFLLC